MSQLHELKTWPPYFGDVLDGRKTFEVRLAARGFAVGDRLKLREWDPSREEYTSRELTARVGYLLPGGQFGIDPNFVVIGLHSVLPVSKEPVTIILNGEKREVSAVLSYEDIVSLVYGSPLEAVVSMTFDRAVRLYDDSDHCGALHESDGLLARGESIQVSSRTVICAVVTGNA